MKNETDMPSPLGWLKLVCGLLFIFVLYISLSIGVSYLINLINLTYLG